jgi:ferric-dicitrate binding protein FerR (iron transport regulator)
MVTEELLKKYLAGNCTTAEQERIAEWYASFDDQPPYFEHDKSPEANELKEKTKAAIQSIIASHTLPAANTPTAQPATIVSMHKARKRMFTYTGIAAAVLIVLMAGTYWVFLNRVSSKKEIVQKALSSDTAIAITPGSNKAILTLADGSAIMLDSAQNGALAQQGNVQVVKSNDGELKYLSAADSRQPAAVAYNRLSTPRGGQFMLTLPDNSKVWLNAASSIKYPTVFTGNERRVEITGEAYFEIEKNPNKPFRVDILLPTGKGGSVEVLGTHFNINAYNDESSVKTTLLEGKVKIINRTSSMPATAGNKAPVFLAPGQQAQMNNNDEIKIVNNANIEATMAWKNGLFQFDDVTIQTVLHQVARWYDVEIVYERDVSQDHFRGKIYRNTDIAKLLNILELSGAHFKIEGKRIIVQ